MECDYFDHKETFKIKNKTIFTGPIDQYFGYRYGELEWRTINLEKEVIDVGDFQGTSVMNYADLDVKYTRIHEPKHLHPERNFRKDKTVIFFETSRQDAREPYYPVNSTANHELYARYKKIADNENAVVFGGRLGDYAYYDMDKTILAALTCYENNFS